MNEKEQDVNFKSLFLPFTTKKAMIFIVIIGLAVFFNSLFNNFVLDDKTFILLNQEIHSFNLNYIFGPSLFNTGYYRPIPALYFTIVYSLFRDSTFFYHFLQISLHIIISSLLFIFFKKVFSKKIALFLSLIFLVHPMQVDSVSYIASSGNQLFFLFGVLALLLCAKPTIDKARFIAIFSLLLLSLLARETGFLFLVIVLLYRLTLGKKRKIQLFLLGGSIISAIYLLLRFAVGHVYLTKFAFVPIARLSLIERIINIPEIISYYLKTFFFPLTLMSQQQWVITNLGINHFFGPLLFDIVFFLLICLLGIYIRKKIRKYFKAYIFFFVWLIIGFFPQIQIFPLDMTVADRWFYFPIIGLLGIIGLTIQIFNVRSEKVRQILYALAILIIVILSTRTIIRNLNWVNALTLYTHDSKIQTNYEIEDNLGYEYDNLGNYKEALRYYKASVDIYAEEGNLYNLGSIYTKMGDNQKAIEYYSKTINSNSIQPRIHETIMQAVYPRLALLLLKTENPQKAKDLIVSALQKYPKLGTLWVELAISEYSLQDKQSALAFAKKGELLSQDNLSVYVYTQISKNLPIDKTNIIFK